MDRHGGSGRGGDLIGQSRVTHRDRAVGDATIPMLTVTESSRTEPRRGPDPAAVESQPTQPQGIPHARRGVVCEIATSEARAAAHAAARAAATAAEAADAAVVTAEERDWQHRHLPKHLWPGAFPARRRSYLEGCASVRARATGRPTRTFPAGQWVLPSAIGWTPPTPSRLCSRSKASVRSTSSRPDASPSKFAPAKSATTHLGHHGLSRPTPRFRLSHLPTGAERGARET